MAKQFVFRKEMVMTAAFVEHMGALFTTSPCALETWLSGFKAEN